MKQQKKIVSGFGGFPKMKSEINFVEDDEEIFSLLKKNQDFALRGCGSSYGDAAIGSTIIIKNLSSFAEATAKNKKIFLDEEKQFVRCDSSVTIRELLNKIIPKGFFLHVVPGTSHVSVGGAIAADVHGKNNFNAGSFCDYVVEMEMLLANGEKIICSEKSNEKFFNSVCGGMGLIGVVTTATIQLKKISSSFIEQKTFEAKNISALMKLFSSNEDKEYLIAWMDTCVSSKYFGESVFFTAEHVAEIEKKISSLNFSGRNIPVTFPFSLLNNAILKVNNDGYRTSNLKNENPKKDFVTFFFPLDKLINWQRLYGKNGFLQYQVAFTEENFFVALEKFLSLMKKKKESSFLTTIKKLRAAKGLLSFPLNGFCVAIDFPNTKKVHDMLNEFDRITIEHSGKIYLAKDARMSKETFWQTQPNIEEFLARKKEFDAEEKFQTALYKRLFKR